MTTNSHADMLALETIEAEAYASLFRAAPPDWKFSVQRQDEVTGLFAPQYTSSFYNRVIGLGAGRPAEREDLDEWKARYAAQGVTRFSFSIPQYMKPAALEKWLAASHFEPGQHLLRLVREVDDVSIPTNSLRFEQASPDQAAAFSRIVCDVFQGIECRYPLMMHSFTDSRWVHFMAFEGDMPVAVNALFTQPPFAWKGFAATLPAFRGRGAHSGLIARVINAAHRRGCQWLVEEVEPDQPMRPSPSLHNAVRYGFRPLYERIEYTYHPTSPLTRLRKRLRSAAGWPRPPPRLNDFSPDICSKLNDKSH